MILIAAPRMIPHSLAADLIKRRDQAESRWPTVAHGSIFRSNMAITLRILRGILKDSRGNSAGAEVAIPSRRFTIGRAVDCQLCCASALIESHHCLISVESDRFVIRDFNSTH